MVARDSRTHKARKINPLLVETPAERDLFEIASEHKVREAVWRVSLRHYYALTSTFPFSRPESRIRLGPRSHGGRRRRTRLPSCTSSCSLIKVSSAARTKTSSLPARRSSQVRHCVAEERNRMVSLIKNAFSLTETALMHPQVREVT